MHLSDMVSLWKRISETSRRLEKIELLQQWLRRLSPDEIRIGVNYLSGRLPQGRFGIGHSLLQAARSAIASEKSSLTLTEVDQAFAELAHLSGAGSTVARRNRLMRLFELAVPTEREFLARLITGELRQGALEGIVTEAVARAADISADEVRRASMVAGDFGAVAEAALSEGVTALRRFTLTLLRPLRPMLAQPADDVGELIQQNGEAALEYKLDGARIQVHKIGDEVRVFSRQLNDVTSSVPELVDAVRRLPASQLILDGEAIALTPNGQPLPFQTTMRRFGRKQDVELLRNELPLSALFFDCLHYDGQDLLARSTRERFAFLDEAVPPDRRIPRCVTDDPRRAQSFLNESVARGHEGVMVKSLQAPYEAGNRGSAWRKIKAAQTLDLVVLAAEWGHGRRRGWLSNLHLGARDPATGQFVMLGKTFKGMTDEMLAWQTERLLALAVERNAHVVYVRPELVVEIVINGVQASPQYPGGLALRFARVKRYREDKAPNEADTIDTVRTIYASTVSLVSDI